MGYLIKPAFVSLILIILSSCADHDNLVRKRVPVMIYETNIPEAGILNQSIEIHLAAGAPNGCYSDLQIELVEIDNRHFLCKATGLALSNGPCPFFLVRKDTTIAFTPGSAGAYFFQINEDPFENKNDTLLVY